MQEDYSARVAADEEEDECLEAFEGYRVEQQNTYDTLQYICAAKEQHWEDLENNYLLRIELLMLENDRLREYVDDYILI